MTRTRLPLILLLCTAFTFSLAACGDDEPTADDVEMQSDGNQEESSDSSSSDDSGSGDDSGSSDNSGSDEESSLDDLGDLGDIAGMENLEECMAIAGTYAGLAMSALGGEEAAQEALDAVSDLDTKLPSELDDALDTVAEAYGTVAEEGILGGAEALDTDEFKEADAEIQAYLDETCGTS